MSTAEIAIGKKPTSVRSSDNPTSDEVNMRRIVNSCSSHPSIFRIKKLITTEN